MERSPWDPLRSCTEVSDEQWTERLFGHSLRSSPGGADPESDDDPANAEKAGSRKHTVSRMILAAINGLRSYPGVSHLADAQDITQAFYRRKFAVLLGRRLTRYTCQQFENFCACHLRNLARRWARQRTRKSPLSLDAFVAQDDGRTTFADLLRDERVVRTETEGDESRAWFQRALDALPSKDRGIVESGEDDAPDEPADPNATDQERAAKSRAWGRLRMVCIVYGHADSEEGSRVVERAILALISNPEDDRLLRQRLFHGAAFDGLKVKDWSVGQPGETALESDDDIRFRFLRGVERIYVICDPWRLQAVGLLPPASEKILRAAFLPWRPMTQVAGLLGCTPWEVHALHVPRALDHLRELLRACDFTRTAKGRESLQKRADQSPEPGKSLLVGVLLQKQPLETVAASLGLSAGDARCTLLRAVQSRPPKPAAPNDPL